MMEIYYERFLYDLYALMATQRHPIAIVPQAAPKKKPLSPPSICVKPNPNNITTTAKPNCMSIYKNKFLN